MNTKGFTLVELIVAIAIGLIIMLAIYTASEMGQRSSTGVGRKVVTMQDSRSLLDLMAIEIRMASFNPKRKMNLDNMWKDGNCAVSPNQQYKGLQIAKSNQILIEMDLTGNGTIGDDNEIINYKYDATNTKITRNVSCGGDNDLLGGPDAETNVINNAEGIKLFRYYNKAGDEIDLDTDQTLIPTIRRVEITIAAQTAAIDPNTNKKRTMIYSTTTIVRNHVLSP